MLVVSRSFLGSAASFALIVGAISVVGAVYIQNGRLAQAATERQVLLRDATRIRATDALMGQRLPADWIDGFASGGVIWIVRPDSCPGCLSDSRTWNALAARGIATRLVLIGADGSAIPAITSRSRITSHVIAVSDTMLPRDLPFLPSTKLIVAPSGEIAFVDARYPAQACGWDLESSTAMLFFRQGDMHQSSDNLN